MKGDMPEVAFRLLTSLPVRTHAQRIGEIERDVPRVTKGELRISLEEMKKGDSRLIFGYSKRNIYVSAQRSGVVVAVREEGGGYRVWRRV